MDGDGSDHRRRSPTEKSQGDRASSNLHAKDYNIYDIKDQWVSPHFSPTGKAQDNTRAAAPISRPSLGDQSSFLSSTNASPFPPSFSPFEGQASSRLPSSSSTPLPRSSALSPPEDQGLLRTTSSSSSGKAYDTLTPFPGALSTGDQSPYSLSPSSLLPTGKAQEFSVSLSTGDQEQSKLFSRPPTAFDDQGHSRSPSFSSTNKASDYSLSLHTPVASKSEDDSLQRFSMGDPSGKIFLLIRTVIIGKKHYSSSPDSPMVFRFTPEGSKLDIFIDKFSTITICPFSPLWMYPVFAEGSGDVQFGVDHKTRPFLCNRDVKEPILLEPPIFRIMVNKEVSMDETIKVLDTIWASRPNISSAKEREGQSTVRDSGHENPSMGEYQEFQGQGGGSHLSKGKGKEMAVNSPLKGSKDFQADREPSIVIAKRSASLIMDVGKDTSQSNIGGIAAGSNYLGSTSYADDWKKGVPSMKPTTGNEEEKLRKSMEGEKLWKSAEEEREREREYLTSPEASSVVSWNQTIRRMIASKSSAKGFHQSSSTSSSVSSPSPTINLSRNVFSQAHLDVDASKIQSHIESSTRFRAGGSTNQHHSSFFEDNEYMSSPSLAHSFGASITTSPSSSYSALSNSKRVVYEESSFPKPDPMYPEPTSDSQQVMKLTRITIGSFVDYAVPKDPRVRSPNPKFRFKYVDRRMYFTLCRGEFELQIPGSQVKSIRMEVDDVEAIVIIEFERTARARTFRINPGGGMFNEEWRDVTGGQFELARKIEMVPDPRIKQEKLLVVLGIVWDWLKKPFVRGAIPEGKRRERTKKMVASGRLVVPHHHGYGVRRRHEGFVSNSSSSSTAVSSPSLYPHFPPSQPLSGPPPSLPPSLPPVIRGPGYSDSRAGRHSSSNYEGYHPPHQGSHHYYPQYSHFYK